MKLTTVKIKMKEWLRGTEYGVLKDTDGQKCCLGFACEALGFEVPLPKSECYTLAMPYDLVNELEISDPMEKLKGLVSRKNEHPDNSRFSDLASDFNDSSEISDEERIFWLKILAKDAGFDFQFE